MLPKFALSHVLALSLLLLLHSSFSVNAQSLDAKYIPFNYAAMSHFMFHGFIYVNISSNYAELLNLVTAKAAE